MLAMKIKQNHLVIIFLFLGVPIEIVTWNIHCKRKESYKGFADMRGKLVKGFQAEHPNMLMCLQEVLLVEKN